MVVEELTVVVLAGLVTALATGLGALPFFFVDDVNDRLNVALWGFASRIMLSASVFGLVSEGVAIGVSFADLPLDEGIEALGVSIPVLAVFITGAIAIQNVPEGIAVAIPLQGLGVPRWRMVWWAVFSSLPQPVGAALAYLFVQTARDFLAVGFGFAAGAMIYFVASELIPEARSIGRGLLRDGIPELVVGLLCGMILMLPLSFV